MKYNIDSLTIDREKFDKLFSKSKGYSVKTGLGKFAIGKSRFLVLEDKETGTPVCFAIENANYKTAKAQFVIGAETDKEAKQAHIYYSKKKRGFDVGFGDDAQELFLIDLESKITETEITGTKFTAKEALESIYDGLQAKPLFGVIVDEEVAAPEESVAPVASPVAATMTPVVMEVVQNTKASKSQFLKEDERLYLVVCPNRKGELSLWLANDKIVTVNPETGNPEFTTTEAGRPWERVLQEDAVINSDNVKKISRVKAREFFIAGSVARVWKEAVSKGNEKITLTTPKKEVKAFLEEAQKAFKMPYEGEKGQAKVTGRITRKANASKTVMALTALLAAGALTATGITGMIDKAEKAENYGKNQAGNAVAAVAKAKGEENKEKEQLVFADDAETVRIDGTLFNFVQDREQNVTISDCMGLSQAAETAIKEYQKEGSRYKNLGYVKYVFKQNSVYRESQLKGIGEELATLAVDELAEAGVILTEAVDGQTSAKVIYPVGNKTVEESLDKKNMISFLKANGLSESDSRIVADAYTTAFEANVSVKEIKDPIVIPAEADIPLDIATSEIDEAIAKAIKSTKDANEDEAETKIEYFSSKDQRLVVSSGDYIYMIDLATKLDENGNVVSLRDGDSIGKITTQVDLLAKLENARLDDTYVGSAIDAKKLYGKEALVDRVTDKYVSDNRQYNSARAYVGGIDVKTTEAGTTLKQVNFMIVETQDGKIEVVSYVPNEVLTQEVSVEKKKLSAASFFAAIGVSDSKYTLLASKNGAEQTVWDSNEYEAASENGTLATSQDGRALE